MSMVCATGWQVGHILASQASTLGKGMSWSEATQPNHDTLRLSVPTFSTLMVCLSHAMWLVGAKEVQWKELP